MLEVLHGFTDRRVGQINLRNDDGIQLGNDLVCSPKILLAAHGFGRASLFALVWGTLPGFFHLPEHSAAGFIIGLIGILSCCMVNYLHAFAGGGVVRVDKKYSLILFERHFVATALGITLGVAQKFYHLIALCSEFLGDCFVKDIWLLKIRKEADSLFVARIYRGIQY